MSIHWQRYILVWTLYIYTYIHMYMCVNMYTYIYICMYIYMCIFVPLRIYIYIHICTCIYIYIHTHWHVTTLSYMCTPCKLCICIILHCIEISLTESLKSTPFDVWSDTSICGPWCRWCDPVPCEHKQWHFSVRLRFELTEPDQSKHRAFDHLNASEISELPCLRLNFRVYLLMEPTKSSSIL